MTKSEKQYLSKALTNSRKIHNKDLRYYQLFQDVSRLIDYSDRMKDNEKEVYPAYFLIKDEANNGSKVLIKDLDYCYAIMQYIDDGHDGQLINCIEVAHDYMEAFLRCAYYNEHCDESEDGEILYYELRKLVFIDRKEK